ncbi:MAG: histidine kinase [Rhizobiaceae bacterium]|nr:histidine kinase [Rhizobiaceae bacterium]
MPTLFRLLTVIAVIVGIVYGGMFALATYVEPNIGEISVRVPPDRINR